MKPFGKFLFEYWQSLPIISDHSMPCKNSLSMKNLGAMLPWISINERHNRFKMLWRLTGTKIDEAFDKNLTGSNLFDLYHPDSHEAYAKLHDCILNTPSGANIERKSIMPNSLCYIINTSHVPLCNNKGEPRYILSVTEPIFDEDFLEYFDKNTITYSSEISHEFFDIGYGLPPDSESQLIKLTG